MAAVYFAVEGTGSFLEELNPGYLEFDEENGSRWVYGKSDQQHHFIKEKEGLGKHFTDYLNDKISNIPNTF